MNAALPRPVDVAADHAMLRTAVDLHRPVSHVADDAGHHADSRAAVNDEGASASGFDQEAAERDVRDISQAERIADNGDDDLTR